jgi:ADP-ribose pyrophosphatase YjhB (NUDIX family)/ribose 1,5-bisphosphokinase PhnN
MKTTVLNTLKENAIFPAQYPKRYITRELRENDDLWENAHLKSDDFKSQSQSWAMSVFWTRDMWDWNIESYGFEQIENTSIAVFSANNYIFSQEADSKFFDDALIIAIDADKDTRLHRLESRSPDLVKNKPLEVKKRLSASVDDIFEHAHFVLNNSISHESVSLVNIAGFLNDMYMKKVLREKYRWRILRITEETITESGKERNFEYAERSPWVRILLTDGKRILLNKEVRNEAKDWTDYRLPGGKVIDTIEEYTNFIENGGDISEAAQKAAAKELYEEADIRIEESNFEELHVSNAGATIKWDLYYFLAHLEEVQDAKNILTEEGEDIETGWYTYEEVQNMCLSGQIQEDRSVAVLLRYILQK